MSRYATPLPGLLAGAVEGILNRAIAIDPGASRLLAPIRGKLLKFELTGLNIDLFFVAGDRDLQVTAENGPGASPGTTISGTPAALLSMAIPDFGGPGSVRITGDAGLAQAYQKLFAKLDPDWEAALTEYLGNVIGPQVYRMLIQARDTSGRVLGETSRQVSHWLRDESRLVPAREEWAEFSAGVDRLREAVDRLDGRIRRQVRS